jgi:hypothetical protein
MVKASDFETEQIQATAWVATDELQPSNLLRLVFQDWSDIFDAPPELLHTSGLPAEFPGAVFVSSDGTRRLEIARNRVNIFWRHVQDKDISDSELYLDFAARLVTLFQFEKKSIGRLAATAQRTATAESPALVLAQHFFS